MAVGRTRKPLLIMLLLILGASSYIVGLVMGGDDGQDQFFYPHGAGEALLPVVPTQTHEPTSPLALEVSFEIRPLARIIAARDQPEIPLSLSYAQRPFPAELSSVAGTWCMPGRRQAGRNLVCIESRDGNKTYRVIDLPGPDEGIVDFPLWGSAVLRGRVLDPDGEPLPGASVWGGLGDPAEAGSWVTCELDGEFELPLPLSGRGLPLVARAKGYASRFRVLWVDAKVRAGIDMHLEVASSLQVQLAAVLKDPTAGRLFLRPAVGETRLRDYPFFLQSMGRGLDERGRCHIDDLPADASVELVLSHPRVILPGASSVRLGRGPKRFIMQAPRAAMIRGRVLDADGGPVPGATLHCFLAGHAVKSARGAALLPAGAMADGEAVATSDLRGGFGVAYALSNSADRLIRVEAAGYWGMELQLGSGGADLQRDFVLQPMHEVAGKPSLHFFLRTQGRRVIRQMGRSWHAWPEGEAFVQPFTEPALVDVLVRSRSGSDGVEREQKFSRVLVSGSVDLEINAQ